MKNVIPIVAGLCLLFALPAVAADKDETKKPVTKEKVDPKQTEETEESYYEQLKKLLKDLTDSGHEPPKRARR